MATTGPDSLQIRITVLLVTLAGATWWLTGLWSEPDVEAQQAAASGPDYYMRQVQMQVLDGAGVVRYQLDAVEAEHLPVQAQTQLSDVTVNYFPANELAWRVSAANATVPDSQEQLALSGGVVVKRMDQPVPTEVRAEELIVLPATDSAITKTPTTVVHQFGRVTSGALEANLAMGHLQLTGPVKGRYEPVR